MAIQKYRESRQIKKLMLASHWALKGRGIDS